ncbi:DUF4233 domain-containing protein [Saccharopolyspora sp. HNM0983]|uniref:DUF4233 domain-containing protein n=1 Tax=Saccharopolyspora montiporae TaxID=2781240 RepID=A0A929B922_9PSEU|nr:DUF4233 domain-containing protein [Saccharopolyspora sp. HNM0983]MBE9374506.1 DUF4233 domain-containing protein [Saccharopolyspora sp. HNM0983]
MTAPGGELPSDEQGLPQAPDGVRDPWKGLRGVMAGTLVMEFIVFLLALPVVWQLGGGVSSAGFALVIALSVLMLVAAFVQRRPWGLWFALALQAGVVLCWLVHPGIGIMGIVFALIWVYILRLRRDVAARMRGGQLYDQLGHPPGYPPERTT